jgi:hypothetical protein
MRATKEQVRKRVEEILQIRLDGAQGWDLWRYVAEKVEAKDPTWGEQPLSDRTIYRYSLMADRLIAESCKGSRKRLIRNHLARRNLYAKSVSAGDYRTALAVIRDEAEMQGLYPPKKLEHTGKDGGAIATTSESLNDAERQAALERIVARYGLPPGCGGGVPPHRNGTGDAPGPLLGGPGPADG